VCYKIGSRNGGSQNANSSGPTDAQKAYRQATASGPYAPAGGADRAMGQEMGDNKAQPKQSMQSKLAGTAETAAGITGAQIPDAIAEALPAIIPSTIGGLKAIGTGPMFTCSRCGFTSDVKGICTSFSENDRVKAAPGESHHRMRSIGALDAVPCGTGLC
jgi:hypothetical protein